MNKYRRRGLQDAIDQLAEIKSLLEEIGDDENDYYNNTPENLQGSARHKRAGEAVRDIQEAVNNLEDAIDLIDSAME